VIEAAVTSVLFGNLKSDRLTYEISPRFPKKDLYAASVS
jgi:hypothetical protein